MIHFDILTEIERRDQWKENRIVKSDASADVHNKEEVKISSSSFLIATVYFGGASFGDWGLWSSRKKEIDWANSALPAFIGALRFPVKHF